MHIVPDRDFGTRDCPSCGANVAANHNRCPVCGYEFPVLHPARRLVITLTGIVLLLALLMLLL